LYCNDNRVAILASRRIAIVVAIWRGTVVAVAFVGITFVIVGVVIRVIAVSIIGIVVPWVEAPPGTANKNKDVTMIKVGTTLVPIAMPTAVMAVKRMILYERLLILCC